jgi:hypothetical protein
MKRENIGRWLLELEIDLTINVSRFAVEGIPKLRSEL